LIAAHAILEFAYALAQALHHFGNLSTAEQHQYDDRDDQQMDGTIPHNNTYLSCAKAPWLGAPGIST